MDLIEFEELLWVAVALFMGLLFTVIFKKTKINFPDVTAFLIAGIIVGPNILGRIGIEGLGFTTFASVEKLKIISDVALGFIAFSIGSEFKLSELKKIGKQATVIGIFQAILASAVVDILLVSLHFILGEDVLPLSACIVMGAIASATAPAATLMVVHQYNADGPLTRLLLPIVALDDAVGLIIFSVSLGIGQAIQGGNLNAISVIIDPLLEIICSLGLGTALGLLLSYFEKMFTDDIFKKMSLSISFVLLTIALASLKFNIGSITISFSNLLVCMMLGTLFCNLDKMADDVMDRCNKWTTPLNACFFVLSGAELEVGAFTDIIYVLIGITYIVGRSLGKYYGSRWSCKLMKCDKNVVKYLGITLLPQAGVALGMCKQAAILGEGPGALIRNITLFSVLIYELVGPTLTKNALTKAGDIKPQKQ